jgi:SAM-dependent methyltransferase
MHPTSLENMQRCWDRYVHGTELEDQEKLTVLDVGGADVNGSYRDIIKGPNVEYLAADLQDGPGVAVRMDDPYKIPLEDGSVDLVVSGQMLEHCEFFWLSFSEMMRVLKPDGYLFLIAPSAGGIHRHPVDCYRFHPDAYVALAKYAGCKLVDLWHDQRGTWRDLVGVFSWRSDREPRLAKHVDEIPVAPPPEQQVPEQEILGGEKPYREVLQQIHETIQPDLYLEIGVNMGASLALARGRAIGIDPHLTVRREISEQARLVEMQSDDFFEKAASDLLKEKPEFVFIDGMHLFEYALRDFMNVEAVAAPNAIVVIDDIFPNHPAQATRKRATRYWTGDVWKLHDVLRKERPDLFLMPIDTSPTGLLLVWGLDSSNRRLWERYDKFIRTYVYDDIPVPDDVVQRSGSVHPDRVGKVLDAIAATKGKRFSRAKMVTRLRKLAGIESEG